jgi:hypothetical protein
MVHPTTTIAVSRARLRLREPAGVRRGSGTDELPLPTASDAARRLHCGFDPSTCAGPIAGVFVIGTAGLGPQTQTALDAIAAAGGTERARYVSSNTGPRPILDATFQPIALAQGAPEA